MSTLAGCQTMANPWSTMSPRSEEYERQQRIKQEVEGKRILGGRNARRRRLQYERVSRRRERKVLHLLLSQYSRSEGFGLRKKRCDKIRFESVLGIQGYERPRASARETAAAFIAETVALLESAAVQTDVAHMIDVAPEVAEGESGGGEEGGSEGGGGDGEDDGGDDDDDPHGVGRGASPIPLLLIALLPLRVISVSSACAAPAVHASKATEYPHATPRPTYNVDIKTTLAEFEGLLATFPALCATRIDERGTWAKWVISTRRHHPSTLGYITAHELQGITTLCFFELQQHPSSSRDGPCRALASRILSALPKRCLLRDGPGVEVDRHGYNLAAVRGLLLAAFNAQSLHTFLYYLPQFRPIVHTFGPGHGFDEMVARVIGYCERHCLLDELLCEVEVHNPRQYHQWARHLRAVSTDD